MQKFGEEEVLCVKCNQWMAGGEFCEPESLLGDILPRWYIEYHCLSCGASIKVSELAIKER